MTSSNKITAIDATERTLIDQLPGFRLRGEGESLYLNPEGGKVGVGTVTPASRLEVFTGNEGYLSLHFAQGGKAGLLFQEAQNSRGGLVYDDGSPDIYTGNQLSAPQVSILDDGKGHRGFVTAEYRPVIQDLNRSNSSLESEYDRTGLHTLQSM